MPVMLRSMNTGRIRRRARHFRFIRASGGQRMSALREGLPPPGNYQFRQRLSQLS